jgi:hypothetical protein
MIRKVVCWSRRPTKAGAADYVIGEGTDALEDKCLDECK